MSSSEIRSSRAEELRLDGNNSVRFSGLLAYIFVCVHLARDDLGISGTERKIKFKF